MDLELQFAVFGGQEAMRALGDTNDFSVDADDSTGEFIQKAQTDLLTKGLAVVDAGWDSPLTSAVHMEKRAIPSIFVKGTVGYKLGLTRVEEKIIDGETWHYGYRGDELIDAQLVRP